LRARPEAVTAEIQDLHLELDPREETDTGPLVSLMVSAGVQVEEVRQGKASLEEVLVTLMEEER